MRQDRGTTALDEMPIGLSRMLRICKQMALRCVPPCARIFWKLLQSIGFTCNSLAYSRQLCCRASAFSASASAAVRDSSSANNLVRTAKTADSFLHTLCEKTDRKRICSTRLLTSKASIIFVTHQLRIK